MEFHRRRVSSPLTGRRAFPGSLTPGTSRIFLPMRTWTRRHRPPPPSCRTPCWSGTSARRLLGAGEHVSHFVRARNTRARPGASFATSRRRDLRRRPRKRPRASPRAPRLVPARVAAEDSPRRRLVRRRRPLFCSPRTRTGTPRSSVPRRLVVARAPLAWHDSPPIAARVRALIQPYDAPPPPRPTVRAYEPYPPSPSDTPRGALRRDNTASDTRRRTWSASASRARATPCTRNFARDEAPARARTSPNERRRRRRPRRRVRRRVRRRDAVRGDVSSRVFPARDVDDATERVPRKRRGGRSAGRPSREGHVRRRD